MVREAIVGTLVSEAQSQARTVYSDTHRISAVALICSTLFPGSMANNFINFLRRSFLSFFCIVHPFTSCVNPKFFAALRVRVGGHNALDASAQD